MSPELEISENPFATERIEKLSFRFPEGVNWDSLMARLEANQYCGAIVGPRGSGKTTLLEQLAPRLAKKGFRPEIIRLNSETGMRGKERLPEFLRQVKKPGFILLDGAEQLSTRHWLPVRAAASHAAGFIVAVHRVSRLPVLLECTTNPVLLEDLVQELTGGRLPAHEAPNLFARHSGNIREAFRELHDRWAGEDDEEGDNVGDASVGEDNVAEDNTGSDV
ncbi:AAA family ATPase [Verrucomicrobiota bacterium sgz303538]